MLMLNPAAGTIQNVAAAQACKAWAKRSVPFFGSGSLTLEALRPLPSQVQAYRKDRFTGWITDRHDILFRPKMRRTFSA